MISLGYGIYVNVEYNYRKRDFIFYDSYMEEDCGFFVRFLLLYTLRFREVYVV